MSIKIKVFYKGLINDRFSYTVELNGHSFDYFTGIGWVAWGKQTDAIQYKRLSDSERDTVLNKTPRNFWAKNSTFTPCYRRVPSDNDILDCLKSDCEAGRMTFHEFCDSFGYDTDSISAFKTYMACQATANKLSSFTFPENED